jgi:hypothetical protein
MTANIISKEKELMSINIDKGMRFTVPGLCCTGIKKNYSGRTENPFKAYSIIRLVSVHPKTVVFGFKRSAISVQLPVPP